MRILALVERYPPQHNAGAEWSLHQTLRELVRRGHRATVYPSLVHRGGNFDGVRVLGRADRARLRGLAPCADAVVTHLGATRSAIRFAKRWRLPVVHLVHNDWHLRHHRVLAGEAALVVFNAHWLQAAVGWPGTSIVVHPPVSPEEYRTAPGRRITLINLAESKGGALFFHLARLRPGDGFLGVVGGYDEQLVPHPLPPNVEIMANTPNVVSDVYRRTRILLVPSRYESWGRVAMEAAVSGIPVIAHPTPGLRESLGDAGLFVDRGRPDRWMAALDRLADPAEWDVWSRRVRVRSGRFDPGAELDALEHSLRLVVSRRNRPVRRGLVARRRA